jgi:Domain of unknown function (DUF4430)
MPRRLLALVLAAAALAGCGGGEERGSATIVVAPSSGHVSASGPVRAGQTVMRALRSIADVDTRYGGRFVQAIDGVEGDLSAQRDWLYFVNGYLGDRSAAEYRLHDGDVVDWIYKSWRRGEERVVTVAFPEPFLHGYAGKRRPAAVRYEHGLPVAAARAAAKLIGARSVAPLGRPVADGVNVLELVRGRGGLTARLRDPGAGPGGEVVFRFAGDPWQLRARPVGSAQ